MGCEIIEFKEIGYDTVDLRKYAWWCNTCDVIIGTGQNNYVTSLHAAAIAESLVNGDMRRVTGEQQRQIAYETLNRSKKDTVDIVCLGCPHYTLERMETAARLLKGKKVHENTRLYITTNSMIKALSEIQGFADIIVKAGGVILEDTCGLVLDADASSVFTTDSAKAAHYAPGATGLDNTWFGTTEECIDAALTGKWRGELR